MATVSTDVRCILCGTDQPVISPVSEANRSVNSFLTAIVRPGFRFGDDISYVCRLPCFSNLTKAVRGSSVLYGPSA